MAKRLLRLAFWNVESLYDPSNGVWRGPSDSHEYQRKLALLAGVIDGLFLGGPDIACLAEVQTERVLAALGKKLSDDYWVTFADGGNIKHPGLGILTRKGFAEPPIMVGMCSATGFERPRALVVRYLIHKIPLLLVVAHWKSRIPSTNFPDYLDREDTARWTADTLLKNNTKSVLMIGDFNAEPFERAFRSGDLRSVRFHRQALSRRATSATLYNTAWRFLAEPDPHESSKKGTSASRPKTTVGLKTPAIFDQLLVSGSALTGPPVALREGSVTIHVDGVNAEQRWGGPSPIHWQNGGLSDHFPLTAVFDITKGRP